MNNKQKNFVKKSMVDEIQKYRKLAYEFADENNGKAEDECYNKVNEMRNFLYLNGFQVESFRSCYGVRGVGVRIVAHRWANYERVAKQYGIDVECAA